MPCPFGSTSFGCRLAHLRTRTGAGTGRRMECGAGLNRVVDTQKVRAFKAREQAATCSEFF